jgi:choice-of-anchor A domain-containing protein
MGQILHGCATTTEAIRRAIQNSQESLRALSRRYGINQKTVAKWKKRGFVADLPTGPKQPKSTVLSVEDEAIIVAFRRHTLLPLDDCLYALQPTVPHLTRSSLHRCLQRHDISRLPEVKGDKLDKKKFKTYPIGYFHIDIAEVRTAEGKLYLYVAIDRTSKFAFVQLVKTTGRTSASAFLMALIKTVPYKIHTVLTDNGIQFTFPPRYADGPTARYMTHMFDMRCRENGIEHRLTRIKHPWTNGQVASGKPETLNGVIYEVFNVISVSDQAGQILTIIGNGSGDPVIFNFISGSNVNLQGDIALSGLISDEVLFNFTGSPAVSLNNNASSYPDLAWQGIILAPDATLSLVNADLDGRVFGGAGGNMQIVSGDNLDAPEGGGGTQLPEPSSLALLGAGLACMAMMWRRLRTGPNARTMNA